MAYSASDRRGAVTQPSVEDRFWIPPLERPLTHATPRAAGVVSAERRRSASRQSRDASGAAQVRRFNSGRRVSVGYAEIAGARQGTMNATTLDGVAPTFG